MNCTNTMGWYTLKDFLVRLGIQATSYIFHWNDDWPNSLKSHL